MPRPRFSMNPSVRARAPCKALAAGVLLRARRDLQRGRTIPDEEREVLGWWAERAGLSASVVDPLLSPPTTCPVAHV